MNSDKPRPKTISVKVTTSQPRKGPPVPGPCLPTTDAEKKFPHVRLRSTLRPLTPPVPPKPPESDASPA